jgi:hypothetical protein
LSFELGARSFRRVTFSGAVSRGWQFHAQFVGGGLNGDVLRRRPELKDVIYGERSTAIGVITCEPAVMVSIIPSRR